MEQNRSPYYDGETSDFEDDVVEIDFEEQFELEEEARNAEDGVFGVLPSKEEELISLDLEETDSVEVGLDLEEDLDESE